MPKIILVSPDMNGSTRVSINGNASTIPHNKKVEVSDGEMEVLQNADLGLVKITTLKDGEDTDAEVKPVGSSDLKDGTEGSAIQAPATPAATSSEDNPLLADNADEDPLKPGDVQLLEDSAPGGDDPIAPESEKAKPAAKRKPAAKKPADKA